MKRILTAVLAFCLIVPVVGAQNYEKALNRAAKKEYKTKLKEFKKGKWEAYGTTRSLEVCLLSHFDKLQKLGEDGREIMGSATRFKSKNIGHQMAISNACVLYAGQAGSSLQGRVVSDMAGNGSDPTAEFDHFYAAYERLVEKEIKGELQESFSVIRPYGDGTFEMQTFFIVSETAASKARIRAFEEAARESAAAQAYADKVSSFVKEGF